MANIDVQNPPVRARFVLPAEAGSGLSPAKASVDRSATATNAVIGGHGRGGYRMAGKRVLDILLVCALIPVSLPIVMLAAVALFLEGGNPFYRQARLGKDGRRFSIVKLRTMVRDADQRLQDLLARDPELRKEWEETQKLKHDPRVTRVGAILRRTSMDELPQLWNVLTGDMSLVGPRPMMPQQLPLYREPRAYFALRPGITGAWQVECRNESSFSERAHYDDAYNRNLSLREDIKILFRTIGVVLRGTGH